MRVLMLCLVAVVPVACAREPVAPEKPTQDALELAVQLATEDLSVAILNKDVKLLAQTMAPQFLAEFEAFGAERDAKLLAFIQQQEEGFVMAYGYEVPMVVSVERGHYGTLLVELRDHAGEKAFDENVRLKKVHFWEDKNGRAYFAGLKAVEQMPPPGVVRQAQLWQSTGFDVANNSGIKHFFWHSFDTVACGAGCGTTCSRMNLAPGGTSGEVKNSHSFAFTATGNCAGPGSCAVRLFGSSGNTGTGFCTCSSGSPVLNGNASSCLGCCFQSAFSSDFWWNTGDGDPDSLGFCHTGTCPL